MNGLLGRKNKIGVLDDYQDLLSANKAATVQGTGLLSMIENAQKAHARLSMPEQIQRKLAGLSMLNVPIVSDVAGLGADAMMYARDPESRTWLNALGTGIGALPFAPSMAAVFAGSRRGLDPSLAKNAVENWELVSDFPTRGPLDPDDYYYHVTSKPNAKKILKEGIKKNKPRIAGRGGGYESHSKGRVFLTDANGVSRWLENVENHLFHLFDDPPDVAILRIRKKDLGELPIDELGTRDAAGAKAYYKEL